jgi:signal transduction histidine kinase
MIIVFAFMAYRAFVQKIIREKNRLHQRELTHQKEISEQYVIVQESERKRIAELLHDDVGNKLNVLSLWLNNEDTWNNKRSKEIVTEQIPQLIDATRTISHALYPVNLERLGLLITLEELISNIDHSLSLQLIVNHAYHKRPVSFEVQIYRIIQEFLSNVIKHSRATEMSIQIRDTTNALAIVLGDNGIGFEKKSLKNGMGLKNIESRLQSIHAFFKWKSKEYKGCKLIIILSKS